MKTYSEQCDTVRDLRALLSEVKKGVRDSRDDYDASSYRYLRHIEERLKGIVNSEIEARNAYPEHEAGKFVITYRRGQ